MTLLFDLKYAQIECERIVEAIRDELGEEAKAVIGLSGGLDSDVVARLTVHAVGTERVKLFLVIQEGMEARHQQNAQQTADDLNIPLVLINLAVIPQAIIESMAKADPIEMFQPDGLLDPARAKCSLRTVVFSTYQDRGYVVLGTSNRTEIETGFFLPFGDGIWHFGPIAHLYKSQIMQLAALAGSRTEVITQAPSAGFWPGQEDLIDLSYWLYHGGPIGRQVTFSDEDDIKVQEIHKLLSTERIDRALLSLAQHEDDQEVSNVSQLPLSIVASLRKVCEKACVSKHRPLGRRLSFSSSRI